MADDIFVTITEADPIYITMEAEPSIYVTIEGGEGALPAGNAMGDIIRYNKTAEAWEVKSEPFYFKGLVLTPALASIIDAEGAIFYSSVEKAVMVCTNI